MELPVRVRNILTGSEQQVPGQIWIPTNWTGRKEVAEGTIVAGGKVKTLKQTFYFQNGHLLKEEPKDILKDVLPQGPAIEFPFSNAPLPGPIYKYLKRLHAETMVNDGIIRIGTLQDYRKEEKYGTAIGDSQEGVRTTNIPIGATGSLHVDGALIAGNLFSNCRFVGNGANVMAFSINERASQYYIYCTSLSLDKKVMADFEADACVLIRDPASFFREITRALLMQAKVHKVENTLGYSAAPCVYSSKQEVIRHNGTVWGAVQSPFPCSQIIHKPKKYISQNEVRIAWQPKGTNPEPFLLTCEGIKSMCEIIEL